MPDNNNIQGDLSEAKASVEELAGEILDAVLGVTNPYSAPPALALASASYLLNSLDEYQSEVAFDVTKKVTIMTLKNTAKALEEMTYEEAKNRVSAAARQHNGNETKN